jgi:hypothetical protein
VRGGGGTGKRDDSDSDSDSHDGWREERMEREVGFEGCEGESRCERVRE